MSALAEALVAAQRRSLATLEKAYVAGTIEAEPMIEAMESCGITDAVDRAFLIASLDVLREWGVTVYVVGVCSRCNFDLTGEADEREAREARERLRGSESPREGTEA